MTEGERLPDEDVSVAVVVEVVQVGAAEAGGFDGYLDVVWGEGGDGSLFLWDG